MSQFRHFNVSDKLSANQKELQDLPSAGRNLMGRAGLDLIKKGGTKEGRQDKGGGGGEREN
jgi:hypothetical protein